MDSVPCRPPRELILNILQAKTLLMVNVVPVPIAHEHHHDHELRDLL